LFVSDIIILWGFQNGINNEHEVGAKSNLVGCKLQLLLLFFWEVLMQINLHEKVK